MRKSALLILIVAVFLLAVGVVAAQPLTKTLTVVYNNIKVYFDGEIANHSNEPGQEPFIYDGVVYLPVGLVAKALEKQVDWDGKNASLYIGKRLDPNSYVDLSSLKYAKSNHSSPAYFDSWGSGRPFSLAGKEYYKGIGHGFWEDFTIAYNLNSMYRRFTGLFGTDDLHRDKPSKNNGLIILGDGKELFRCQTQYAGDQPQAIDIDITGVNQIEFRFFSSGGVNNPVLANPRLYY